MECYNCSAIYNDYLGYCPYCGAKKEEFNICPECGKKLKKDIVKCPKCDKKAVKETDEMKSERLVKEGLKHHMTSRPTDYFNEAIRYNKHNIDAWANKAEYLKRFSTYKAIKCCDASLKIAKDNEKLLFVKAKVLKEDEDSENSEIILNNLLKRCNQKLKENELNEEAWILKGEILSELNEEKRAIECYSKALEINPKNEELWIKKASIYWRQSNYNCEIDCYKKAIKLNPANAEYYKKIGNIYEDYIHDSQKAIQYYNKSLKLNPDNEFLWDTKGRLEKEMGKYDEALENFNKNAELDPSDESALISKAEILCKLKRFDEALKCYNQIPLNPYAGNLKADVLIKLKRYDEALKAYDECILQYPDYDESYLNKGRLLHNLKIFKDEVDCYDMLLNKDDHIYHLYKHAQLAKAVALSEFDRKKSDEYFSELLNEVDETLKIFPDDAEDLERKADLLYFSGNLKESLIYYDKTLECDNVQNRPAVISSKGRILYELKDYKKAVECFDKALEISDYFYALQYKGYCLEKLNEYDKAMECYEKCLEIEPENKEIELKIQDMKK